MVALLASILITVAMVAALVLVASRREPGRPLSWGEAFVAATFVFTLLFMAYGVVPHHWLTYAGNELNWRADKYGIPLGPFGEWVNLKNPAFEDGITFFGRGRLNITAAAIADIIATLIYVVAVGGNILGWLAWQRRGQRRAERQAAIETSAYGRPLVRQT
jgi:hypothetical protein